MTGKNAGTLRNSTAGVEFLKPAMKQQFLTIAAAALLSIPTFVLAQDAPAGGAQGERRPGGGRGFGTPEERLKRLTEALTLTQEQQDKVKAIYAKNEETFKAAREKGRNMTEEERTKFGEAMRAQNEEIQALLTPEQKEKYKNLRPQGGRRGEGRPGGPGGAPGGGAAPGSPAKPEEKK
jgi:Spy/CpxP family protein refolding chaperone